jgi:hypothetical protein
MDPRRGAKGSCGTPRDPFELAAPMQRLQHAHGRHGDRQVRRRVLRRIARLGSGRIAASAVEAPNTLANQV